MRRRNQRRAIPATHIKVPSPIPNRLLIETQIQIRNAPPRPLPVLQNKIKRTIRATRDIQTTHPHPTKPIIPAKHQTSLPPSRKARTNEKKNYMERQFLRFHAPSYRLSDILRKRKSPKKTPA
jgi:hypothetical protein